MNIAPSILGIDPSELQVAIDTITTGKYPCDRVHVDVMDGLYVPAESFIAEELEGIVFAVPTEVHLMVDDPHYYFDYFQDLGCEGITFHIENTGNQLAQMWLGELKSRGLRAGVCIDGYTSPGVLEDEVLALADQVLLMSVKAGKGGQSFMSEVLDKIKAIRERDFTGEIEIDGGVNLENAQLLAQAGADIVVVGSDLMKRTAIEDRPDYIRQMQGI